MIEYTNSQVTQVINEHVHSERDRNIIIDRLVNGMCYEPLAEKYDLSVTQVKRIIYKLQMVVFKYI